MTGRVKRIGDTTIVSSKAYANTIPGMRTDGEFYDRLVCKSKGVIQMAKFYVLSGSIRGIVDCYDSECAAVWMVNRAMEPIGPICDQDIDGGDEDADVGMFALDDTIQISEQGFGRDDCEIIDTHMAFLQWHQLKRAIETIHQQHNDKFDNE